MDQPSFSTTSSTTASPRAILASPRRSSRPRPRSKGHVLAVTTPRVPWNFAGCFTEYIWPTKLGAGKETLTKDSKNV